MYLFGRPPGPPRCYGPGSGCPGVRFAAVLRTTPVGRALPILPAFPDAAAAECDDRPALRPTSFRSLRQRGAPFIAPGVTLHSACYGSSRCIRPAYATINPPYGPLPAGQPAAHRQPIAPLPGRARPQKRPSRRPPSPPDAATGHRLENAGRLPQKSAFRPRRPNS